MCGFVAGLLRDALEPERLDRALETLHHRGPDAVGRWISPDRRWFLGHTRLSIIGLNNGDQPIANAAGDVQIVVNGEFYGYARSASAFARRAARSRPNQTARSRCTSTCARA